MILGLDVSTSITGASVIDNDGKILYCEAWKFQNKRHFPDLFAKAEEVRNRLLAINHEYDIEAIFIEQSLFAFMRGKSSAKTLLTLSKFNGIVSWLAWDVFEIMPEYLGATQARKICGVPKKQKGQDIKKVVLNFLLDNEPKFGYNLTKHDNPVPGTYDRADSLIIAKAGIECLKLKN